jgi:hypothetical protein
MAGELRRAGTREQGEGSSRFRLELLIRHAQGKRQLKAAARRPNLQRLKMPVMLTVGTDDNRSIRRVTERRLTPNMNKLGKTFVRKSDYPGDHKWFWQVRKDHFSDVTAFLAKHMK